MEAAASIEITPEQAWQNLCGLSIDELLKPQKRDIIASWISSCHVKQLSQRLPTADRKLTVLHVAALHSCTDALDRYIHNTPGKTRTIPYLYTSKGESILDMAIKSGKLATLQLIVASGTSIKPSWFGQLTDSFSNNNRMAPLHRAASYGLLDIVRYFIEGCKLDPNSTDSQNWTALTHAAYAGRINIATYLLIEQNMAPTAQDLHIAIKSSVDPDGKIIDIFLSHNNGDTGKQLLRTTNIYTAIQSNHPKKLAIILKHGNIELIRLANYMQIFETQIYPDPILYLLDMPTDTLTNRSEIFEVLLKYYTVDDLVSLRKNNLNLLHALIKEKDQKLTGLLLEKFKNSNKISLLACQFDADDNLPISSLLQQQCYQTAQTLLALMATQPLTAPHDSSARQLDWTSLLNKPNKAGDALIHLLASDPTVGQHIDIGSTIATFDLDLTLANKQAQTPLQIAIANGNHAFILALQQLKFSVPMVVDQYQGFSQLSAATQAALISMRSSTRYTKIPITATTSDHCNMTAMSHRLLATNVQAIPKDAQQRIDTSKQQFDTILKL